MDAGRDLACVRWDWWGEVDGVGALCVVRCYVCVVVWVCVEFGEDCADECCFVDDCERDVLVALLTDCRCCDVVAGIDVGCLCVGCGR